MSALAGFWPLFKRELFAFFVTPLAWVLIVVFLISNLIVDLLYAANDPRIRYA